MRLHYFSLARCVVVMMQNVWAWRGRFTVSPRDGSRGGIRFLTLTVTESGEQSLGYARSGASLRMLSGPLAAPFPLAGFWARRNNSRNVHHPFAHPSCVWAEAVRTMSRALRPLPLTRSRIGDLSHSAAWFASALRLPFVCPAEPRPMRRACSLALCRRCAPLTLAYAIRFAVLAKAH